MDEQPDFKPTIDPAPDEAPGGADAIERDKDDFPIVTPDQPRSAQLEEQQVPDAIEEPDEGQQEGRDSDPDEAAETKEEPA